MFLNMIWSKKNVGLETKLGNLLFLLQKKTHKIEGFIFQLKTSLICFLIVKMLKYSEVGNN